jgi:hypothetical protein
MPENTANREFTEGPQDRDDDSVRILPDDSQGASQTAQMQTFARDAGSVAPPPYDHSPIDTTRTPAGKTERGRPSTCLIVSGTAVIIALSCMLLAFASLRSGLDGLGRLGGIIPSFGFNVVTTPTVTIDTSRPSVIEGVRALSRLETVNYQLEKVITGKSTGPLFDFLTSDRILLVAHGEVVAGVDLQKLGPEDIEVVSDTVVITMPNAEILSSKLDNDKTYVYDRQTGLFNKPDPNLESQMRSAAEQQIVLSATEDGILVKAEENAKQTLRSLVQGLGYKDVQFKENP